MRTLLATAAVVALISPIQAQQPVWKTYETDHFKIYHQQTDDYAKKVGALAEESYTDIGTKWFGKPPVWRTKCDLYLYNNSEHLRQSGAQHWMTGCTNAHYDDGKLISVRISVRIDVAPVYTCILPHEITHALLAGHFGKAVPRWLDEGMSGQAESEDQQKVFWNTAASANRSRFAVKSLMTLGDYPQRDVDMFYAQSIILVRHLVKLKGDKALVAFVEDALKDGHEKALQKHYKLDFETLEKTWMEVPAPALFTPIKSTGK